MSLQNKILDFLKSRAGPQGLTAESHFGGVSFSLEICDKLRFGGFQVDLDNTFDICIFLGKYSEDVLRTLIEQMEDYPLRATISICDDEVRADWECLLTGSTSSVLLPILYRRIVRELPLIEALLERCSGAAAAVVPGAPPFMVGVSLN